MLATENLSRSSGHPLTAGPACPNCGRAMHLARIAPRAEGLSDLRIYRCGECGVSLTEAADDIAAFAVEAGTAPKAYDGSRVVSSEGDANSAA